MVRRILYLHGLASSPLSRKGQAFDAYLSQRGFVVERLDLRLPNRNGLRLSAMIDHVLDQLDHGGPATLIGSSLGGLVAAHVAKKREDVPALVLMAPAFRFAERWRERLGEDGFRRWKNGEPLEVEDHAGGEPLRVDFGFYEDAAQIDIAIPELTMPVLLMHGRYDEVVDIAVSRELARSHGPRVTFVELDDDHGLAASIPMMLPLTLRFLEA
jgi:pimeloyl-ACP methyl ester carboxylesterase